MDRQGRKKVMQELKQKEEEALVSILPMTKELLKDYFDYLDSELTNGDKGDSLKLTEEFCRRNNLEFEKVKDWAAELGGYDDVEILWNCEEKYDFLLEE